MQYTTDSHGNLVQVPTFNKAVQHLPSVRTLATIAYERAKELRAVLALRTNGDMERMLESFPHTSAWIRACYHPPTFHSIKMHMADERGNYV